jgi:hypothetical protein
VLYQLSYGPIYGGYQLSAIGYRLSAIVMAALRAADPISDVEHRGGEAAAFRSTDS